MNAAFSGLAELLRTLQPQRQAGIYVYATLPADSDPSRWNALAVFRETEATTLVLPERQAMDAGLPIVFRAAWITLQVHSDLQAVGLTAAVSGALAAAGIASNVIAAVHHDHLFVPVERADDALAALRALQARAMDDNG
jgi:uncharacterized protein